MLGNVFWSPADEKRQCTYMSYAHHTLMLSCPIARHHIQPYSSTWHSTATRQLSSLALALAHAFTYHPCFNVCTPLTENMDKQQKIR